MKDDRRIRCHLKDPLPGYNKVMGIYLTPDPLRATQSPHNALTLPLSVRNDPLQLMGRKPCESFEINVPNMSLNHSVIDSSMHSSFEHFGGYLSEQEWSIRSPGKEMNGTKINGTQMNFSNIDDSIRRAAYFDHGDMQPAPSASLLNAEPAAEVRTQQQTWSMLKESHEQSWLMSRASAGRINKTQMNGVSSDNIQFNQLPIIGDAWALDCRHRLHPPYDGYAISNGETYVSYEIRKDSERKTASTLKNGTGVPSVQNTYSETVVDEEVMDSLQRDISDVHIQREYIHQQEQRYRQDGAYRPGRIAPPPVQMSKQVPSNVYGIGQMQLVHGEAPSRWGIHMLSRELGQLASAHRATLTGTPLGTGQCSFPLTLAPENLRASTRGILPEAPSMVPPAGASGMGPQQPPQQQGICKSVREFDLNRDGVIDFEEFASMMKDSRTNAAQDQQVPPCRTQRRKTLSPSDMRGASPTMGMIFQNVSSCISIDVLKVFCVADSVIMCVAQDLLQNAVLMGESARRENEDATFDPMLSRERPDLGSVLRFTGALESCRSGVLGAARAAPQIDALEAWAAPSSRHSWAKNLQGRLV